MSAPKKFHKAFRELPPAWRELTYLQRSIIQDLWRLSDLDCSGAISTAGEPVQFLVRALDLKHRQERSPAVRAVNQLFDLGLLISTDSGVRIQTLSDKTRPAAYAGCMDPVSSLSAGCLNVVSIPEAKLAESLDTQKQTDQKRLDQKEEREGARPAARENSLQVEAFQAGERLTVVHPSPAAKSDPKPQLKPAPRRAAGFVWMDYQNWFVESFNAWNAEAQTVAPTLDALAMMGRSSDFMALQKLNELFARDLDAKFSATAPHDHKAVFVAACETYFDTQTKRREPRYGNTRFFAQDWATCTAVVMAAMVAEQKSVRVAS